jgi:RNA polymerase sigma-70 factor (ECF subfamily)
VGLDLDLVPIETPEGLVVDPARLQEALDELPAAYRAVVVAYYFDDCSYRKMAAEMGIPLGTVMSRLARAKAHLRRSLTEPEPPLAGSGKKAVAE